MSASGSPSEEKKGFHVEQVEKLAAPVSSLPQPHALSSSIKVEAEHSRDLEHYDNQDRESVTSVSDSVNSSAPSTPAPVASLSVALHPSNAMASAAASYSELSAALSNMGHNPLTSPPGPPPPLPLATPTPPGPSPRTSSGHTPSSSSSHLMGKRANRTRFTDYQIKVLQEYFEQNAYPKDDDLENLSKMLNLSPRVIVVWFQNARQKARKNYENQPAGETFEDGSKFTRTPGLNYQCKKCFTVFQRYYELIKHQRTHCFKDDQRGRDTSHNRSATSQEEESDSNGDLSMDTKVSTTSEASSPRAAPATTTTSSTTSSMEYKCEKCSVGFPRFELWKEHQAVHQSSPGPKLLSPFAPTSAFGMLQNIAQQQREQQQQEQQQLQPQPLPVKQEPAPHRDDMESSPLKRRSFCEEDDEEREDQPRDKRMRTTILPEQLDYLYQKYQLDCNPSRKQLENIATEVGLKKRVVQVWFQNTRARERKGQYRAHQQIIHKRCPFCRALFRAKSALESHLATKHAEEMAKGEVNVDSIPDEEVDTPVLSQSSPGGSTTSPGPGGAPALDMAKLLNNPYNVPNPFMPIVPPGLPGAAPSDPIQSNMKRLYEDSLKKYLDELSHASHQPKSTPASSSYHSSQDTRALKSPAVASTTGTTTKTDEEDAPLDLSKPVNMKVKCEPLTSKGEDETFLNRSSSCHMDDSKSETYSESTNEDQSFAEESNPSSPTASSSRHFANKRYRTQMSSLQIRTMKHVFNDYKTPTMAECEMLGKEIGLPKRVVQVWFQNARAKEKKSKLAYTSTFGGDVEMSRPPEECKLCSFKYSHKYTIQDHVFTHKHIDKVKAHIHKQGDDDESTGTSNPAGKGAWPTPPTAMGGSDPALVAHPHLAQLHAMGLQAMGAAPALAGECSSHTTCTH